MGVLRPSAAGTLGFAEELADKRGGRRGDHSATTGDSVEKRAVLVASDGHRERGGRQTA